MLFREKRGPSAQEASSAVRESTDTGSEQEYPAEIDGPRCGSCMEPLRDGKCPIGHPAAVAPPLPEPEKDCPGVAGAMRSLRKCRHCGAELPEGDSKCDLCGHEGGTELSESEASIFNLGSMEPEDAPSCTNCGAIMTRRGRVFTCTNCNDGRAG